MKYYLLAIAIALNIFCSAVLAAESPEGKSEGWLLDAENDAARFDLLQKYLRGFDQPMWEVGKRFRAVHDALSRDNYELAAYHWDKIRITIKNGYLKRPARMANAEAILLNTTWEEVNEAFGTRNAEKAWAAFDKAKNACMACHAAESVPYMNNQHLFDLSRPSSKNK